MEPILSKQEIADLLKTLQGEGGDRSGPKAVLPSGKRSEAYELNLFDLAPGSTAATEIANFDIIIDLFSGFFSTFLSQQLQKTVTLKTLDSESKAFKEYYSDENLNYTTGILSLKPLKSGALLTYDPRLSFTLVEILLGNPKTSDLVIPDRGTSNLERCVLETSMKLACQALERAFQPLMAIASKVIRATADPRLVSLAEPESMVVIYRFEVEVDETTGRMELLVPTYGLEPCRESLSKLTRQNTFEAKEDRPITLHNLVSMPVTLMAQVCALELSVKQLIELKEDTVIPLGDYPGDRVDILVEGVPKFRGRMEQSNRKRNVHILNAL